MIASEKEKGEERTSYPLPGARSRLDLEPVKLNTQQWYMSANLYDIYHCCVYIGKTPGDEQKNCPKHVEFYCKLNLIN